MPGRDPELQPTFHILKLVNKYDNGNLVMVSYAFPHHMKYDKHLIYVWGGRDSQSVLI